MTPTQDSRKAFEPGDKIKDNDPRTDGRVLTITRELHDHVWAQNVCFQEVRILKRRIYTDGKPRRSGFSLLAPTAEERS